MTLSRCFSLERVPISSHFIWRLKLALFLGKFDHFQMFLWRPQLVLQAKLWCFPYPYQVVFVPLSRCKGFADTVFPTFPRVPLNHHLATDQSHRHSFSCHLLSVVSHSLVHINFKSKIWKKFQFAHACRDLASPSDLVLLLKRRVHECMYVISHVGTSMYVWWQSVQ